MTMYKQFHRRNPTRAVPKKVTISQPRETTRAYPLPPLEAISRTLGPAVRRHRGPRGTGAGAERGAVWNGAGQAGRLPPGVMRGTVA